MKIVDKGKKVILNSDRELLDDGVFLTCLAAKAVDVYCPKRKFSKKKEKRINELMKIVGNVKYIIHIKIDFDSDDLISSKIGKKLIWRKK